MNPSSSVSESLLNGTRVALLPLARTTFDMEYATQQFHSMKESITSLRCTVLGGENLLTDDEAANKAISNLLEQKPDLVMVLQTTFTDAQVVCSLASATDLPLLIWSMPEPRNGERLRLNSFCGLNLASHALGMNQHNFKWLFADPAAQDSTTELEKTLQSALAPTEDTKAFDNDNKFKPVPANNLLSDDLMSAEAQQALDNLKGKRIARIGEHPPGFSTCAYDAADVHRSTGITVEEKSLSGWFEQSRNVSPEKTAEVRQQVAKQLTNLDEVDQRQLASSLNLAVTLDEMTSAEKFDAFALRCWPETFTEYGGAACGAAALMGEKRVPCACEADVLCAVTQLLLQEVSGEAVFLVDLVDFDIKDNSAVVWHCGQAPLSMCSPSVKPEATIHTNRKMPLLYQFPLRAGEITLLRWSQSKASQSLVIGTAEVLDRPMSCTGTSGVIRFERAAADVLDTAIESRLEHHVALAYGDHRDKLIAVAGELDLPVLEL